MCLSDTAQGGKAFHQIAEIKAPHFHVIFPPARQKQSAFKECGVEMKERERRGNTGGIRQAYLMERNITTLFPVICGLRRAASIQQHIAGVSKVIQCVDHLR